MKATCQKSSNNMEEDTHSKYQMSYPLCSGLFRDNLQHCLGYFARLQSYNNEGMSYKCQSNVNVNLTWTLGVVTAKDLLCP